ncbi:uncharacterized protein GBIM_07125 [Gryllus bimaculatus]|nr:uncharacterized protein GBIM_07125 [Gryllus bimaculatus]
MSPSLSLLTPQSGMTSRLGAYVSRLYWPGELRPAVHDATAKPSAGLLMSGNVLLYGDYDACLWRAREPSGAVQPRYCLARLQPELADAAATGARSPRLAAAWHRFRSLDVLRSNIDDPGHRIPRISAVQWGLCVPAGCSADDVRAALDHRLQPLAAAAGLRLAVRVAPDDCQTTPTWWPTPAFTAGVLIFGTLLITCIVATNVGEMWSVLARGASLYTDPFLLLSGLLSTHALLRTLDRDGRLHWPREYASRVLRLLPSLAALIMWCTLVLPWLGSGPHWNLVVRKHAELCKTTWWRNMLFIHNYYGFENMCLDPHAPTSARHAAVPLGARWRGCYGSGGRAWGATVALAAAPRLLSASPRARLTRLLHWASRVIGRVLCWPGFQVTTRLSYALYLVQFPVFFYNVGSARTDITYSFFLLFNFLEFGSIMLASIALTIFVDLPAQHVRSLLLRNKRISDTTSDRNTVPPSTSSKAAD